MPYYQTVLLKKIFMNLLCARSLVPGSRESESCFPVYFSTRGRFTLVRNVKPKEGKKVRRVAKVIPYKDASKEDDLREYEMLKSMRQEHIIRMYEAYLYRDFCVLVLEKLYGENVARSLSLKNKYTEHHITKIMKQASINCGNDSKSHKIGFK